MILKIIKKQLLMDFVCRNSIRSSALLAPHESSRWRPLSLLSYPPSSGLVTQISLGPFQHRETSRGSTVVTTEGCRYVRYV